MASYIDQSLGAGEAVIIRARFHWLYTVYAWGSLLLPLVVLLGLYIYAGDKARDAANPLSWALFLVAVWALLGLITLIKMLLRQWTTEIGITSHRFVEKYGLFTMRTNEIALPNIEGVRVHQSFLGRVFGYGTVKIEGTGVDSVTTPHIEDPVGFVRAIQTAKEHVERR
ncbi:MAG: PH domain-containing protein [Rhizomicrobium sp.]